MPKIIENARELILTEARVMLLDGSYADLNIREIAKRSGIGIGTFYNYYKTKEQLVSEIFRTDWKKVSDVIAAAEKSEQTFKEKCNTIYKALERFIEQYTEVFYELAASGGHQHTCKETNKYDMIYSQMEALIHSEMKREAIQTPLTPDQLSRLLISSFIFAHKHKYIDFDTLYDGFKL